MASRSDDPDPKWTAVGCLLMLASAVLMVTLAIAIGVAVWRAFDGGDEPETKEGMSNRPDTLRVPDEELAGTRVVP